MTPRSFTLHRAISVFLIALVISGGLVVIAQIWTGYFSPETLFKILATDGILIVIAGFMLVARADFSEHKRLKDENYLD